MSLAALFIVASAMAQVIPGQGTGPSQPIEVGPRAQPLAQPQTQTQTQPQPQTSTAIPTVTSTATNTNSVLTTQPTVPGLAPQTNLTAPNYTAPEAGNVRAPAGQVPQPAPIGVAPANNPGIQTPALPTTK